MPRKCRILVMGPEPPKFVDPRAELLWVPVIRVERVDGSSLKVLSLLEKADAIAFTSPRGPRILKEDSEIHSVYEALRSSLEGKVKAVVGPETGRALYESFGLYWNLMPGEYRGGSLGLELARSGIRRVVIARSRRGERELLDVLRRGSVEFYDIPVYDVHVDAGRARAAASIIREGRVDVVAFTSSSIALAVCSILGGLEGGLHVVSIGPTTARVIRRECGVEPEVPERFNYEYLIKKALSLCRRL